MQKKTVFVGMSGGVDSSVSAALLKKQGYHVVGVFIRTWHPDFIECNEEEERLDAMRVAAHLDIPFLTFDFEDVYKKEVADYMIAEYKAGRTPNPDVMCNKEVKFGAFLKKAISMGADYVATGHYSQNQYTGNAYVLMKGKDPSKDQCYFLWTLRQEQISKILFPVGHLPKTEVRKLAKKFKLPVAEKKDSQGICFLGAIDLKDFLKHYIKSKKGKVLNESGEEIGHHDGAVFHTLGERHGFTITKKGTDDGRYYIVAKDIKKNTLTVAQQDRLHFNAALTHSDDLTASRITLENTNWILARTEKGGSEIPEEDKVYTAQIRYHGEFLSCKIICQTSGVGQVIFDKRIVVASGQSIVLYDKDICLGGGVVV